jgi:hypothetical protein
MNQMQTVGQLLQEHVTREVESSDRVYRNVYVPKLPRVVGLVGFCREQRGARCGLLAICFASLLAVGIAVVADA